MVTTPVSPGPDQADRPAAAPRTPPPPELPPPSQERPGEAANRGLVAALILIALGAVLLLGNLVPFGGSTLFLGLGAAFAIARVITGRHGYAVPAGILLGFGAFVLLEQAKLLPVDSGPWFFILLGLGFFATYVLDGRLVKVWPLYPAAALIGFGALLMGLINLGPLADYVWLAPYWPLVLIVLGLWLLVRGLLPAALGSAIGAIVVAAAIVYSLLVVAATGAANGPSFAGPGFVFPGLGVPTETVTLTAPIAPGDTFRVTTSSGNITIRPGSGGEVRAEATIPTYPNRPRPEVSLTPGDGVLILEAIPQRAFLGDGGAVSYVVEVPAANRVEVHSSSGDVDLTGLSGPVQASTSSGDLDLDTLGGPIRATSSSGNINLQLPAGPIDARIQATSGNVIARLAPGAAARIDIRTTSGNISESGLGLADRTQSSRGLSGSIGGGTGVLAIDTTSGNVQLGSSR